MTEETMTKAGALPGLKISVKKISAKRGPMKEKRRHERFPVGIEMEIRANGQSLGRCQGAITDLSVGGMAFKTNAALDEGMSMYLKINIPLEIRGEVRHRKGSVTGGLHRYGVRFHKIGFITPESKRPEKRFVAVQFQKPSQSNKSKEGTVPFGT